MASMSPRSAALAVLGALLLAATLALALSASPASAEVRSPSQVTMRATVAVLPDGLTTIWSPARTRPEATVPA